MSGWDWWYWVGSPIATAVATLVGFWIGQRHAQRARRRKEAA